MHGLIHVVLRSLVLEVGGDEAWERVLERLEIDDDAAVLELRQHEDAVTVSAVQAAVHVLGVELDAGLRLFGEHFVKFLHETTSYIPTIRSFGSDVLEFVRNIDHMHRQLQEVYTDSSFPSFLVSGEQEAPTPTAGAAEKAAGAGVSTALGRPVELLKEPMKLSFASKRGALLAPVAEGALVEVARRVYGQELRLEREPVARDGYHVTWLVHVRALGVPSRAPTPPEATPARERSGRSAFERRAGALWHSALASMGGGAERRRPPPARAGLRTSTRDSATLEDDFVDLENELAGGEDAQSDPSDRGDGGAASAATAAHAGRTRVGVDLFDGGARAGCGRSSGGVAVPDRYRLVPLRGFVHPATEALFRTRALARGYAETARALSICYCLVSIPFVVFAGAFGAAECPAVVASICTHLLSMCFALAVALASAPVLSAHAAASTAAANAALARIERITLAWLATAAVQVLVLTPCRLALLLEWHAGHGGGGADDGAELLEASCAAALAFSPACSQASTLLVAVGVLIVGSTTLPMCAQHFAALALVTVVATVVAEACAPLPGHTPMEGVVDAALLAALSAVLWRAGAARMCRERQHFTAQHSILAATRRWQQLKKTEVETHLRASSAEVASTARSKLIRVVMHDLRSPLLAVRTVADTLVDEGPRSMLGEPSVKRHLETLRTCSAMMEGIVSDMLDFERIDSGRMVLVHRPFSLPRLFADAEMAFAQLCARKNVRLTFEHPPDSLASARFVGDARRLLQCLCNGLSNANKFCDPGGAICVRAWQTAHARKGWARVHVAIVDDGVGLDNGELRTLQQGVAFSQVGKGQMQGNGGTGLGLTIVRHILKLHHGSELALYSAGHRKGTTFELRISMPLATDEDEAAGRGVHLSPPLRPRAHTLSVRQVGGAGSKSGPLSPIARGSAVKRSQSGPWLASSGIVPLQTAAAGSGDGLGAAATAMALAASAPEPEPSPADAAAAAAAAAAADRAVAELSCLHVEDDMMLQLSIQARLFGRHKVACDVASNGREAVDLVASRAKDGLAPYSLVLMDNQMPTMSGAEATRALRALGFEGRIIGMTGDPAGSTDRDEFEAAGLDECVDKTPEGVELVERHLLEIVRRARHSGSSDQGRGTASSAVSHGSRSGG